jgi:hypothetical protein
MTLPENPPPRKRSRIGLYAPLVLLLVTVAAWTGGWSWMRSEVFRHMDAAASGLGQSGYQVDWSHRSLSGFPFRLDLDIEEPRLRETAGWGLSAPRLKAEAFVFAPDHWVIVAPSGVTLTRRVGGPVVIVAKALRASLSDADAHPPRFSVEGIGLTFAPGPGAAPVAITEAAELHIHSKSGPQDQGAFYLGIVKARAPGPGFLADIAQGAPVTLTADAIFSHAAALKSGGFAADGLAGALRAWSQAGGELTVRQLSLEAGGAAADARSGSLAAGGDGRLKGVLNVTLKQGPRLLAAVTGRAVMAPEASRAAQAILAAHAQGESAAVTLDFQAGQTTLGPVAIGPAPRVY